METLIPSPELNVSLTSHEAGSLNWFPGLRQARFSEIRRKIRACRSWADIGGFATEMVMEFPEIWGLEWQSGSLAIISNSVGLDRTFSAMETGGGGGDIGFRRPAVRAELNLVKPLTEAAVVAEGW